MAKSKTKKEPAKQSGGSKFSRRRILVAAGVLVLLVGLSWVTLGMLKKGPDEKPKPAEPIVTKITMPVALPGPSETLSAPLPETPEPPQPEPEPPAAEPSTPKQPAAASQPSTDNFVMPKPKAPSLQEQTRVVKEMAESGKPSTPSTPPAADTQEKPAASETSSTPAASQPKQPETASVPQGPDAQAKVPFQVLDQANIPSAQPPAAEKPTATEPQTPATAPDISAGASFPPPPETSTSVTPSAESPAAASTSAPAMESGEKTVAELPRPKWQTMDKNWEKVEIETTPPVEGLKARDSNWRQMDVGQEETAKGEPETPLPEVAKETPTTSEPGTAAATGEKPVETPSGTAIASKTHKPVVSKTETSSAKPPHTAKAPASTSTAGSGGHSTSGTHSGSHSGGGQMQLRIINETGRPGQGQVYRDVLAAMGYRVNKIEDRPAKSGPTTIMYGPGLRNQAVTLAERLPGKRSVTPAQNSSTNEIVIVVR